MNAIAAWLPDNRLHLQHGPIDLIIDAQGEDAARRCALRAAVAAFPDILPRLVDELPLLRAAIGQELPPALGPVARRMISAVWPWRDDFITPMAAVAGAVADQMLAAMMRAADCRKIVINNGGDIAFHLAPGERLAAAIVGDVDAPALDAGISITAADPIRGLATSGWKGRSQSLGIADAVSVLAEDAAFADAAATMIANAVDVDHPAISRLPAIQVRDDSDLGSLPVTVAVGDLPVDAIELALDRGLVRAQWAIDNGLIAAAYLRLQGHERMIGGIGFTRLAIAA